MSLQMSEGVSYGAFVTFY